MCRSLRRSTNLLHVAPGQIVGCQLLQQQVRVSEDRRQYVVEIVRDAARQPSHGLHLVGLPQAFLARTERILSFPAVGDVAMIRDNRADGSVPKMTDEDRFAETAGSRSMLDAILDGRRHARMIETVLKCRNECGHVIVIDDPVEALALQLLGRVARDRLDGSAVVQRDAALVEQRDRFLTLIDECAEARFTLNETAPQARAFACIAKRSAKQRRVGPALDQIVLRAGVHRRNRQPIIVARGEHDDRRVAGRMLQAAECLESGAIRQPQIEEDGVECTGREPEEGIREAADTLD